MRCTRPLTAFQTESGTVVFHDKHNSIRRELTLPCGQCFACKLNRSADWGVRCMHEAQMHDSSVFVTLTFSDEFIPDDWSLDHKYFQDFIKRVRARFRARVRYYMCGEYGTLLGRPHYHACLFGINFSDKYYWRKSSSGFELFRSPLLEDLWSFGQCEIGEVSFNSAAYVARYMVADGSAPWIVDPDTGEMVERKAEYSRMSLKPGIGASWYHKFKDEVFPLDRVVVNGMARTPPKYYKKLLDKAPGQEADYIEYRRYMRALELQEDSSAERLAAQEAVLVARTKSLRRS